MLVASVRERCDTITSDLRISDSAVAEVHRGATVLVAVLDGQELARDRIVERLSERHGEQLRVGSAIFPDDGLTLDGLVDLAAARASNRSAAPSRRVRAGARAASGGGAAMTPGHLQGIGTGRALVTGCAGFIGSSLSERLVGQGWDVVGVDCFTAYYARERKDANLWWLRSQPRFELVERDLAAGGVPHDLLEGVDVVFHLAAQAGVRDCYGTDFDTYVHCNVVATQRLLEACVGRSVRRFVYASSSSVYGHGLNGCTREEAPCLPVSPYGMTKLATEALANTYMRESGVPVVGLRYFSVYGPRQRPDMAFTAFLERAIEGRPITIYGDGRQERDWTYIDDVVTGTIAGAEGAVGSVYNIGGGTPVRLADAVAMLEELLGRPLIVEHRPRARGDARKTAADGGRALRELGFRPEVGLADGLRAQAEWALAGRPCAAA